MAQVNGEYKTICDGLLDGYKGKVYGDDEAGTEHDDSCTMQKVIIKNGKVVSATGELPMFNVIADLGESNNGNNDKTITKTDSKTNIKLEAPSGVILDNTTMDIIEITSGATFDKIKKILVGIKNFKAFDITLKSNDINIQPKGKVRISIPIPVDFDASRLEIYRFEEDGTKTEYQVKVANGYASFDTDHFSTYVLGEAVELSNETQDKTDKNVEETTTGKNETQDKTDKNVGETTTGKNDTKLPQTGEERNLFADWLSVIIFLGSFWLISMLLIEHEKKKMTKK